MAGDNQATLPLNLPALADSAVARGHLRLACYGMADTIRRRNAQGEDEIVALAEKIYRFCMPGESENTDPAPAATTSATGESGAARRAR